MKRQLTKEEKDKLMSVIAVASGGVLFISGLVIGKMSSVPALDRDSVFSNLAEYLSKPVKIYKPSVEETLDKIDEVQTARRILIAACETYLDVTDDLPR